MLEKTNFERVFLEKETLAELDKPINELKELGTLVSIKIDYNQYSKTYQAMISIEVEVKNADKFEILVLKETNKRLQKIIGEKDKLITELKRGLGQKEGE